MIPFTPPLPIGADPFFYARLPEAVRRFNTGVDSFDSGLSSFNAGIGQYNSGVSSWASFKDTFNQKATEQARALETWRSEISRFDSQSRSALLSTASAFNNVDAGLGRLRSYAQQATSSLTTARDNFARLQQSIPAHFGIVRGNFDTLHSKFGALLGTVANEGIAMGAAASRMASELDAAFSAVGRLDPVAAAAAGVKAVVALRDWAKLTDAFMGVFRTNLAEIQKALASASDALQNVQTGLQALGIPTPPTIPTLPTITPPAAPNLPSIPGLPQLPSLPNLPSLAQISAFVPKIEV